MPTYQEILEQKRATVREADARQSARLREQGATLIDVREQDEVDQGIIPGAIHIPRGFLEMRIEETVRDHDTPVIVYCFEGARASNTFVALEEAGVTDVRIYFGSWNEWSRDPALPIEEGLPYGITPTPVAA